MQEHGTAATGDAGPRVVIDLDDQVVEPVVAPEPVAWLMGRAAKRAVVAAVAGILAPGHRRIDAGGRQPRCGLRTAVGAPPQPPKPEQAARRGPVTFALVGPDTGATQHDRDRKPACDQHAQAARARPGAHLEQR